MRKCQAEDFQLLKKFLCTLTNKDYNGPEHRTKNNLEKEIAKNGNSLIYLIFLYFL